MSAACGLVRLELQNKPETYAVDLLVIKPHVMTMLSIPATCRRNAMVEIMTSPHAVSFLVNMRDLNVILSNGL